MGKYSFECGRLPAEKLVPGHDPAILRDKRTAFGFCNQNPRSGRAGEWNDSAFDYVAFTLMVPVPPSGFTIFRV